MATLVANCPRCSSRQITFDAYSAVQVGLEYNWQRWFEVFSVCRACHKSTTFVLSQKHAVSRGDEWSSDMLVSYKATINDFFQIEGHISPKDQAGVRAPGHLPRNIESAFNEGASCLAIGCSNAAAAMFRLCVDLATKPLVASPEDGGPANKVRRNLGLRLDWLFENGVLPLGLKELAECLQQDGNDGAHDGGLTKVDAEDLLDFTNALLERMFTEPAMLQLAKQRRDERRAGK